MENDPVGVLSSPSPLSPQQTSDSWALRQLPGARLPGPTGPAGISPGASCEARLYGRRRKRAVSRANGRTAAARKTDARGAARGLTSQLGVDADRWQDQVE